MSSCPVHRGLTLVETLATCTIAALAMAMGASLLSGAGDPLPRAKETLLEAHAMARLIAVSDGPATLVLERNRLVVRDGHGEAIVQRDWPSGVGAAVLEDGLRIDRLGRVTGQSFVLRTGSRSLEVTP